MVTPSSFSLRRDICERRGFHETKVMGREKEHPLLAIRNFGVVM